MVGRVDSIIRKHNMPNLLHLLLVSSSTCVSFNNSIKVLVRVVQCIGFWVRNVCDTVCSGWYLRGFFFINTSSTTHITQYHWYYTRPKANEFRSKYTFIYYMYGIPGGQNRCNNYVGSILAMQNTIPICIVT